MNEMPPDLLLVSGSSRLRCRFHRLLVVHYLRVLCSFNLKQEMWNVEDLKTSKAVSIAKEVTFKLKFII